MANPGSDRNPKSKQPDQFSRFTGLGFQLLLTIGILGYLGYWLDGQLNTLPLFMVLLILAALAGNIYMILRAGRDQ